MVRYAIAGKHVEQKVVANEMERALIKKDGDIWLPIIDEWKLKGFLERRDKGRLMGRAEGQAKGVENVTLAFLDFQSEKNLTAWLRQHTPKRRKNRAAR